MDTSFEKFEQYVRQEFVVVRKDLEKLEQSQQKLEQGQQKLEQGQQKLEQGQQKLEQGQQKLEKAIGDSQTRITQWVVGLFVGTIVIIIGLSSVLVTSFMLTQ